MNQWVLPVGFVLLTFFLAGRMGWRYPIMVTAMLVLCMLAEAFEIGP